MTAMKLSELPRAKQSDMDSVLMVVQDNMSKQITVRELLGEYVGDVIVTCQHCGQWAARKTECKHCGGPV